MKYLKIIMALFLSCIILTESACGLNNGEDSNKYYVYYMNSQANKLVEKEYHTDTTAPLQLMKELVEEMNTRQKQKDCVVIKPDNVVLLHLTLDSQPKVANVYFNKEYNDLSNSARLLLNAAMVKTLTQLEEVEYIQIFVDGSLAEYSDGTPIGLLSEEDFVEDSNKSVGDVEWKNLTLYYADKLGDKLVPTNVSVAYNKNVSLEKIVVERLIQGPSDNTYATLSSDMKLLSISVSNRTCYVNLNSAFLTDMVNVSNEIPIYSIVNSLCELDTVDSVRILVNGDSGKTFRESISLENTFTFNEALVSVQ